MNVMLLTDGPGPWQERLEQAQRPARAVWRVGRKDGSGWERVGPGADPWETPAAWDMCVMVQERQRQHLPFMLRTAPEIPILLITPWVTAAQAQVTRMRWVRVICPPRHAAEPGRLSDLLAMVAALRAGAITLGNDPTGRHPRRRQQPNGRCYVYGA
ncbi:hypothetical protein F8S13_22500 [Chloroflexia bacterium SDU3-3]|nr:hypothetical protein F8S13_22500 [Chloroflexia bacterium SDU3-3]